jgi:hypothetical protein
MSLARRTIAVGVFAAFALSSLVTMPIAHAATGINATIHYQGKVSSINGTAVANGAYNMRFKIYDALSAGTLLWTETWNTSTQRVTMTGGLFSVALGTHVTMTGSVNFNTDNLYLQVEFDPGNDDAYEETFAPRRRFSSVPYAHNANTLDGLDSAKFLRKDIAETMSGTLTIKPNSAATIGLEILSAAGSHSTPGLKISTQGANHILFGTGGTTYDVNLYRLQANVLRTDDSFYATGSISGSVLKADTLLSSSGALAIEGGAVIDNGTFVVDAANNRVGIGTSSPESALHVEGGILIKHPVNADLTLTSVGIGQSWIVRGGGTAFLIRDQDTAFTPFVIEEQARDNSLYIRTGGNVGLSTDSPVARLSVSGSGTFTHAVGIGTTAPDSGLMLEVVGAASGAMIYANSSLRSSGSLVVEGAMSGASLYVASSINGAGLTDCDLSTSALRWDATTGRFSCGSISSSSFGSGNILTIGDARYLRRSGGTMTGVLTVNITGSDMSTVGLNVINTISGAIMHAEKSLTSSGSLVVEGSASFGNSGGSPSVILSSNTTSVFNNNQNDSGHFQFKSEHDANLFILDGNQAGAVGIGTDSPGSRLSVSGAVIINANGNLSSTAADAGLALEVIGTMSGKLLQITGSGSSTSPLLSTNGGRVGIGTLAGKAGLDVSFGGMTLMLGAENMAHTRGDGTAKIARVGLPHHTNTEEPVGLFIAASDGSTNTLTLGGGSSIFNAATSLIFNTAANSTTTDGTERMRITSSGQVGIGVSIPSTTNGGLDIASGGLGFIFGADNNAQTRTNATTKISRAGLKHYTNSEEPVGLFIASSSATDNELNFGGGSSIVNAATVIRFLTAANNTTTDGTERLRIISNGNISIGGKATPVTKLEVVGTISGSLVTQNGAGINYFRGTLGIGTTTPAKTLAVSGSVVIGSGASTLSDNAKLLVATTDGDNIPGILIRSRETTSTQDMFKIITDVGTANNTVFRVTGSGGVYADAPYNSSGADYAEYFYSSTPGLAFGELVCLDVTRPSTVKRCTSPGDGNVIGIVSSLEQAAFIGNKFSGAEGIPVPGTVLVGLLGQLKAKVVVESGATIRIGDQLTPATKPGFGRRANPGEPTVGVAMQAFEGTEGATGLVEVLVARKNSSLTAEAVSSRVLETIQSLEIEDEIAISLQAAMDTLSASGAFLQPIQDEVTRQMASFVTVDKRITALEQRLAALSGATIGGATTAEIAALIDRIAALELRTGIDGTATGAHLAARTLALEHTLSVGSDARIAGDLYLDGAFHTEDLSVPGVMTVGGTLNASRLVAGSGSAFLGAARVEGDLEIATRLRFASGAVLTADQLVVQGALAIIGDVTIEGIAIFFKDVKVKGELVVSNRQAGYAEIPVFGTGVTVRFSSGFVAIPVVTASPDVPVLYGVTKATATGFTIRIDSPATGKITFSWLALATENPQVATGEQPHAAAMKLFPVDALGVPVSTNPVWNSCIRNLTTLDSGGQPYSCDRYHEQHMWEHPDLTMSFLWNTALTPPLLILPDGYQIVVVDNGTTSSASSTSSVSSDEQSSSSSSSAEAASASSVSSMESVSSASSSAPAESSSSSDVSSAASSSAVSSEAVSSEAVSSEAVSSEAAPMGPEQVPVIE